MLRWRIFPTRFMTLLPVIIIVRISRSGSTSHRRIGSPTIEFVTGSKPGRRSASNRRSHKTRIVDELLYICDSERGTSPA